MQPSATDPNEAWHHRRMACRRRELGAHWPIVLLALGMAIAIGLTSPDRSQPDRTRPQVAAAEVK